jgi:hypothetical protein
MEISKTPTEITSNARHLRYISERENNNPWTATSWEDVVWEAKHAIGPEDGQAWVDRMADILANPYFVKDPILVSLTAHVRMRNLFPHCIGHTWASPHPWADTKLGVYQIWRPSSENTLIVEEVRGEDAVRLALAENA